MSLDDVLKKVREEQNELDQPEAELSRLRKTAPDLADFEATALVSCHRNK
jgi:hypothetical protein